MILGRTKTEDQLRQLWSAPWLWMALVVLVFCVPLFVGLEGRDFDSDEAIYSFGVDVMLRSGDWLTPKAIPSETSAFLEKPPLKFWIVGLPIRWGLLPANEFGMRFWDALMGSVAFLYIFAIGRRLAGPLCGLTAVLLLFTHGPLILEHGLRTNTMEAAVFLTYAAGMYHFLAWRSSGPDTHGHVFAIALYFVLGFMTKFVAALFLPLVLGLAILLKAEDRSRLRLQWPTFVLAGLVAVILIAPWFVYEYFARGPRLFDIMFRGHVVKRFTAYLDPTHLHPWPYYFEEIWRHLQSTGTRFLALLGATLLVTRVIRRRWLEGALVLLWFALPMTLISLGTSKLYHYAYPFLPPVALAGGYAATVLVEWVWRLLRRPVAVVLATRDRVLPRVVSSAPGRAALMVLAAAGAAMAAATYRLGRINIETGDTLLFRNSSVARPLVAGALTFLLGARAMAVRTVVGIAVWFTIVPFQTYAVTLAAVRHVDHPLQDLRACVSAIAARAGVQEQTAPGVWVEARSYSQAYTYYLYRLGPWQLPNMPSDATVAMHLFAPTQFRLVMLGAERYDAFRDRLAQDPSDLLRRAATEAGLSPEELLDSYRRTEVGIVPLAPATLILPGPYSACTSERFPRASR